MGMEKMFETKIKSHLDKCGAYHVKFFANSYTKVGVPDVLVCLNGKFVAIEVKAPNGKPSALQIHNLEQIRDAGGYGLLLYPKDWLRFVRLCDDVTHDRFPEDYNYFKGVIEQWKLRLESSTC